MAGTGSERAVFWVKRKQAPAMQLSRRKGEKPTDPFAPVDKLGQWSTGTVYKGGAFVRGLWLSQSFFVAEWLDNRKHGMYSCSLMLPCVPTMYSPTMHPRTQAQCGVGAVMTIYFLLLM